VLTIYWLLGALVPPQKWVTLVGANCGLGFAERLLAVAMYDLWHVMRGADILSVISGLSDLGLTYLYSAPDYGRGTVVGSRLVSIEICYGFRRAEFVITNADVQHDSYDTYSFIKKVDTYPILHPDDSKFLLVDLFVTSLHDRIFH
jgi:hypothetical protein